MTCARLIVFGVLTLCFGSWVVASDSATTTYDLAQGIRLAEGTTYRMLLQEIERDFKVALDRIEYLVVGPHKLKRYYISSERLSSDKVIPSDIIEAFALGDNPRLICKPE